MKSTRSCRIGSPEHTGDWLTGCSRLRLSENAGPGSGSISRDTPIPPVYADDPPRVIWMFRDWVIDAINTNQPFDQFTIDQICR